MYSKILAFLEADTLLLEGLFMIAGLGEAFALPLALAFVFAFAFAFAYALASLCFSALNAAVS